MKIENGYYIWIKGSPTVSVGKHFKTHEFECTCKYEDCKEQKISVRLVEKLDQVRNSSKWPVRIHSAFRCKKKQEDIRKEGIATVVATKTSTHELGDAADISSGRLVIMELFQHVPKIFKAIGIALNFLHVDLRDDKVRRWRY